MITLKRYWLSGISDRQEDPEGNCVPYETALSLQLQVEELRKIDLQNCRKIDQLTQDLADMRKKVESRDSKLLELQDKLAIAKALLHKRCCPDDAVWMARKVLGE